MKPPRELGARRAAMVLSIALSPIACGSGPVIDAWYIDQDAGTDGGADAGADVDDGGNVVEDCAGQCLPKGRVKFAETPMMLWTGASEFDAPPCPEATEEVYTGRADLNAPNICPICTCGDPSCVLPTGITASTAPTCPNDPPGATLTPFDAPAGWSGACISPGVIPSSLLASITIAPITLSACTPKGDPVPGVTGGPVSWGKFALACRGTLPQACKEADHVCAPSTPEGGGFRACVASISSDPGVQCPDAYPDKVVFYGGIDDGRTCSACACDPPVGADCSALVAAYQDAACVGAPIVAATITMAGPGCHAAAPGMTLKGMAAQWVTNNPGTCTPSGGEPSGAAVPTEPTVFCCQAPPM